VTAAPVISPIHQSGDGIKARFPISLYGNGPSPVLGGASAVFTQLRRKKALRRRRKALVRRETEM